MNATEKIKMQEENKRLREALKTSQWAMQQPVNDWKGECEAKALKACTEALAATEQSEAQEPEVKIKRFDVDGEFVLYRDHLAAIAALKQEQAGMVWQPIETVPKDGRDVLLLMRDRRILEADWQSIDGHDHAWIGVVCGLRYEGDWGFTHWMLPADANIDAAISAQKMEGCLQKDTGKPQ